jgi:hypothetical protein
MSEARNEPSASDVNSGTVIIDLPLTVYLGRGVGRFQLIREVQQMPRGLFGSVLTATSASADVMAVDLDFWHQTSPTNRAAAWHERKDLSQANPGGWA